MNAPSIVVEGLGKRYQVDGKPFWALRDVNLEVRPGEVVGILGRNGAGKTTLLRVLSRITEPTEGRARLWGRVGSLLETGTGFHEELSGRENVLLNGAILGMRPAEIRAKFDEIVDFAGIGSFIDTAVKRYSSGMRMRLAFSIAAHLDTDILLVDEVLAVGDLAFQEKCLSKMDQITTSSTRSVLFVSHNIGAVQSLCSRAVLLEGGKLILQGKTEDVVRGYRDTLMGPHGQADLRSFRDRPGSGVLRFVNLRLEDLNGTAIRSVPAGGGVRMLLDYECGAKEPPSDVMINIVFVGGKGVRLFGVPSDVVRSSLTAVGGSGTFACTIPRLPLAPGHYDLVIGCLVDRQLTDKIVNSCSVAVTESDYYNTGRLPGNQNGEILVDYQWSCEPAKTPAGAS